MCPRCTVRLLGTHVDPATGLDYELGPLGEASSIHTPERCRDALEQERNALGQEVVQERIARRKAERMLNTQSRAWSATRAELKIKHGLSVMQNQLEKVQLERTMLLNLLEEFQPYIEQEAPRDRALLVREIINKRRRP